MRLRAQQPDPAQPQIVQMVGGVLLGIVIGELLAAASVHDQAAVAESVTNQVRATVQDLRRYAEANSGFRAAAILGAAANDLERLLTGVEGRRDVDFAAVTHFLISERPSSAPRGV